VASDGGVLVQNQNWRREQDEEATEAAFAKRDLNKDGYCPQTNWRPNQRNKVCLKCCAHSAQFDCSLKNPAIPAGFLRLKNADK
jgi:hypothetical protein